MNGQLSEYNLWDVCEFSDACSPESGCISVCDDVKRSSFWPYGNALTLLCLSHPLPSFHVSSLPPVIGFRCVPLLQFSLFSCTLACFLILFVFWFSFVCSFEVGQKFSQSPWEPIMKTLNCRHVQTHQKQACDPLWAPTHSFTNHLHNGSVRIYWALEPAGLMPVFCASVRFCLKR